MEVTQSNQVRRAAKWAAKNDALAYLDAQLAAKVFQAPGAQQYIEYVGGGGKVPPTGGQLVYITADGTEAIMFAPYIGVGHAHPNFKSRISLEALQHLIKEVHH